MHHFVIFISFNTLLIPEVNGAASHKKEIIHLQKQETF